MPRNIEFKGVDQNIGTFSSYPNHGEERKINARYDRKNFYPTIFLETEGFPTAMEDTSNEIPVGKIKLLTIEISAVRKEGKKGIFLNEQLDVVDFKELTVFKEELDTVIKSEFIIKHMQILSVERLVLYKPPEKMKKMVERLITRKERFRDINPEKYREAKETLNKNIGFAHQTPNGIFDGLSLSYLKSISRIEMYNSISRYYDDVLENFIDEVRTTRVIPEFEKDKTHWRKIGY